MIGCPVIPFLMLWAGVVPLIVAIVFVGFIVVVIVSGWGTWRQI